MHLFLLALVFLVVGGIAFGVSRIKSAKTKALLASTASAVASKVESSAVQSVKSAAASVVSGVQTAASATEKKL